MEVRRVKVISPNGIVAGKSYEISGIRFTPKKWQYDSISNIVTVYAFIHHVPNDFPLNVSNGIRSVSIEHSINAIPYSTGTLELNPTADIIEVDS